MTDKLISDLGSIGAAIADNTATEVQRNGQTTTEQALGSDWKTYIKSWIAKADVGLGNVDNTSDVTKNAASVTLTNKTLTSPVINTPTGIVKGDVGLGNVSNNAQLTIANNLSDVANLVTTRANLAYNQPVRGPYINGQWQFVEFAGFGAGSAVGASTMRLTPFYVKQACHITDIGVNVATANAGDNVQFAIYAADATTNKPTGSALSSTPNVSVTATGRVSGTLSASVAVTPGLYWLATQCSSATPALQIMTSAGVPFTLDVGNSTLAGLWPLSTTLNSGYQVTGQTFGTWPSLTSATFVDTLAFVHAYKVSVP